MQAKPILCKIIKKQTIQINETDKTNTEESYVKSFNKIIKI